MYQGAWVTQLVMCPTLVFGSGCNFGVVRLSPTLRSMLSMESAQVSLSLLSLPDLRERTGTFSLCFYFSRINK